MSCHLGNGSSLAAVDGGRCVDTSMGLTPLAGLPMGTRAGDMDVGVVEFIANKYDMTISEAVNLLNKKSGMLGLSGVSSDFRDLGGRRREGPSPPGHRGAGDLRVPGPQDDRRVRRRHGRRGRGGVHRRRGRECPLHPCSHSGGPGVHGHYLRRGEEQHPW